MPMQDNLLLCHVKKRMEFYENDLVSLYLSELIEIENLETDKQSVQLFSHPTLGKVLVINGEIQHVENYQCIYHEMLVHFPLSFLPTPKHALIIGGGSLFAAHEILKYNAVERVDLCDHDPCVINLMKKHYSHAENVLADSRFRYINVDAKQYVEKTIQKYDIVINDCFNIIKEVSHCGKPIADLLFEMLTNEGLCVDIVYRHIFDKDTTIATLRKMKTYSNVCFSLVTVPEYPGILHIEVLWGKNKNLSQNAKISLNEEQYRKQIFRYFNPDMLPYYLYIPPYVKSLFTE